MWETLRVASCSPPSHINNGLGSHSARSRNNALVLKNARVLATPKTKNENRRVTIGAARAIRVMAGAPCAIWLMRAPRDCWLVAGAFPPCRAGRGGGRTCSARDFPASLITHYWFRLWERRASIAAECDLVPEDLRSLGLVLIPRPRRAGDSQGEFPCKWLSGRFYGAGKFQFVCDACRNLLWWIPLALARSLGIEFYFICFSW